MNLFDPAFISTSFEGSTLGWAGYASTTSLVSVAGNAGHGSQSMRVTSAAGGTAGVATSGFHPCTAGLPYWFGFYATATLGFQLFVNWYNSAGTYLSGNGVGLGAPAGGAARLTAGFTAPTGATKLKVYVEVLSAPAGGSFYLDAVQYEQASAATPYMDYNPSAANVASEADWILTCQLADGGLAWFPDKLHMVPYFSSLAALGLARATEVTGDRRYTDASWRWLSWYAAHMDGNGFVTDYSIAAGTQAVTSTGDMDSTDSYASTFLHAAYRTWQVSGDTARLRNLSVGLNAAVRAIQATQQADGLTWAKPSYHVKYLMDNVEVYAGLQAAHAIGGVIGDAQLQSRALSSSRSVVTGVATMWDPNTESYYWARHENGVHEVTNWSKSYPDASAQVWAVAFGLVRGERARNLVNRFNAEQPLWDQPAAMVNGAVVGYNPVAGWAFMQIRRTGRSLTAASRIRSAAITAGRAWPHTLAVAGERILLESTDRSYLAPIVR